MIKFNVKLSYREGLPLVLAFRSTLEKKLVLSVGQVPGKAL